jgi:SAM-dependent methyltransferase
LTPQVFAAEMSAFALARSFALVLLPCNTFSTLPSQARRDTLACVRRVLQPGGLFAFAIPNPHILRSLPRRGESEVEEEFLLPETGGAVQVSSAWQRDRQEFHLQWHYDLLLPDGGVERHTLATHHSLEPVSAYEHDLQAAGLQLIEAYGDFDGSPAGDEAEYWIGVARHRRQPKDRNMV